MFQICYRQPHYRTTFLVTAHTDTVCRQPFCLFSTSYSFFQIVALLSRNVSALVGLYRRNLSLEVAGNFAAKRTRKHTHAHKPPRVLPPTHSSTFLGPRSPRTCKDPTRPGLLPNTITIISNLLRLFLFLLRPRRPSGCIILLSLSSHSLSGHTHTHTHT